MKKINKILILLLLAATMSLSIGYSAINNIILDIKGTVTAEVPTTFPYLPTGFSKVEGTTLETGLVIQDGSGNQYVWVEVPKTEKVYEIGEEAERAGLNITEFTEEEYGKIEYSLNKYSETYGSSSYMDEFSDESTVKDATGLTLEEYERLKQTMLKSVYQNGGFYIGRYETGSTTARTSSSTDTEKVIKADAYPYNYVTCSDAQRLASEMASGEYTTSLLFGVQWDLMIKYLETYGVSINSSSSWGNYNETKYSTNANAKYSTNGGDSWRSGTYTKAGSGTVLLSSGAVEKFAKQNIYDLAGNMWEWTLECSISGSELCTMRGGACNNHGNDQPASAYFRKAPTAMTRGGFRVTIY